MNAAYINGSLIEKLLQAFSWMLVHSLWQGLLLALMAGCTMLVMRKSTPDKRYTALATLLVGYLLGCAATFVYVWDQVTTAGGAANTVGLITISDWRGFNLINIFRQLGEYCTHHASLIAATWFVIFAFRCWQMTRAIQYVRKVKKRQLFRAEGDWQSKLNGCAQQLGIGKAVTLLESGITKVPVVIGHLKPVIYMPVGLLANLPSEQVEAVLMHELAHIRRNDYLFNWIQHIAETIFFFNPGMLWVSSLLREEREHCCDDIALHHTGNKKQFIQALITFKEQVRHQGDYAMAFPGKKSQLLQRVSRIVHNRNNAFNGIEKGFLMLSAFICLLLLATFATEQKKATITVDNNKAGTSIADASPEIPRSPAQQSTTRQVQRPGAGSKKPQRVVEGQTVITIPAPENAEPDVAADERQAAEHKRRFEAMMQTNANRDFEQEEKARAEIKAAELQRAKAEADRRQADIMHAQAERDRKDAERHREQAAIDRAAAERNREQAELHRQQAGKDRVQAMIHVTQAEKDRQRAAKDRERAEIDRAKAELDRQQAEKDRARADNDRRQAEKRRQELAAAYQ